MEVSKGDVVKFDMSQADFYIKKEDAEKHGYTRGCGGCSSWFRGLARQPHNEACRERFRNLMKEDAKVLKYLCRLRNPPIRS